MKKKLLLLVAVSTFGMTVGCGEKSDSLTTGWGQAVAVPSVPCEETVSYEYDAFQLVMNRYRDVVCRVPAYRAAWVLRQGASEGLISCGQLTEEFMREVSFYLHAACKRGPR
jgi:hypothetical protein